MIKIEEFNCKIEELKNNYKETYEMFDYLNNSRDNYIDENIKLEKKVKMLKRSSIYFFICFVIEFVLFLIATNI